MPISNQPPKYSRLPTAIHTLPPLNSGEPPNLPSYPYAPQIGASAPPDAYHQQPKRLRPPRPSRLRHGHSFYRLKTKHFLLPTMALSYQSPPHYSKGLRMQYRCWKLGFLPNADFQPRPSLSPSPSTFYLDAILYFETCRT